MSADAAARTRARLYELQPVDRLTIAFHLTLVALGLALPALAPLLVPGTFSVALVHWSVASVLCWFCFATSSADARRCAFFVLAGQAIAVLSCAF